MDTSTPRFVAALPLPRPRGSRLLQGFSPSLARPVQFASRAAFEHWIWLEANADVRTFCERPIRTKWLSETIMIDFWVQTDQHEYFAHVVPGERRTDWPETLNDLPVEQCIDADRLSRTLLVQNWQRMLTTINAARGSIPATLIKAVLNQVNEPMPLSHVEARCSGSDPACIRAAVFESIRLGRLCAPSLQTEPLSLNTVVAPAQ